ncbi:MAG: maltose ABC transporter permease MalF [Burkholderiaceae bacterium]|nr:maltose ABC transporter permease MalF [Burkholderiaceae bacterium]
MGRRWTSTATAALSVVLILAAVLQVHAVGQTLLAVLLLACSGLAVWAYTSPRTHALRYLLPGIGAALVFVIFPMLYTVGIGFTNYSSSNLLEFERARQVLQESAVLEPGSQRGFTLERRSGGVRVHLDGGLATAPLTLGDQPLTAALQPGDPPAATLSMAERVALLPALRQLTLQPPEGPPLRLASLRSFGHVQPLYDAGADGSLTDRVTGIAYRPDDNTGFFTSTDGDRLQPGYRVGVGLAHYATVFSEGRFREPFLGVLIWTVLFSAGTVLIAGALGLLLAVLLNWEALPFRGAYRLVLFLPYAVPGFISILIFKGLFNQNLGEINFILDGLFGVRPAWFSDPALARTMLLIVNVWLGFPYMMVLCSGLIKAIPADLYEASAVSGAGPWVNFSRITAPLIVKPLTPLLIAAFAFNFNNFVLVSLLTGGRPDRLDTTLPAGTTDILVSYTWRIAFQDSGQQFGLAAAISTVIFLIVAAITLLQMRFTRVADEAGRR